MNFHTTIGGNYGLDIGTFVLVPEEYEALKDLLNEDRKHPALEDWDEEAELIAIVHTALMNHYHTMKGKKESV